MQDQSTAIVRDKDFSHVYEETRQRFNSLANQRGLNDQINAFLAAEIEMGQFDHKPYILHMILDGASLVSDKLNLDIAHTGLDYYFDHKNHQAQAALERQRVVLSNNLVETIFLLGNPRNYVEAIAQQKLILNINPHYLDARNTQAFIQQREKINAHVNQFAQQTLNHGLSRISDENKIIQQQQDNALHSIEELRKLGQSNQTALTRVEQSMPHKAQVELLKQKLEQLGINVDGQLSSILSQNEALRHDLEQVLTFIEDERLEKINRLQQERKAANYQGLTDACHFVGELGNMTGCRELSTLAGITQAGVQIHRAANQIMTAGLSGAALLGPYAAIGMAVLGVFSLFQRTNDPNRVLMKQLIKLSQQITELHKDILKNFQHLDQRLSFMLEKMKENFDFLQNTLTVSVNRRLADIQSQLETLTRIVNEGFKEMLLKDLKANIAYINDLKDGISENNISQSNFEERLREIRGFLLETSTSPLLNGTTYCNLLQPSASHTQQIIGLLHQRNATELEGLMGLLATFAKNELKIPELQSIDAKEIFHPRLWRIALEAYCDLKKLGAGQLTYDPDNKNLIRFRAQLENQLNFMHQLRSNPALYQKLLSNIATELQQLHAELGRIPGINQPLLAGKHAIDFEIPQTLKDSSDKVLVTNKFFSSAHLLPLLPELKINIPKEFFQAEQLNLGHFEYRMHFPASLHKKHHKSEGHYGKYRYKDGETAGLEINFILGGQKIPIFKPGKTTKRKFGKLKLLYRHLVGNVTEKAYNANTCAKIRKAIEEQNMNGQKQLAQRIALTLHKSEAYHRLIRLNHLLVAYLTLAGFPSIQIENLHNRLLLTNMIELFEEYAAHPGNNNMPILQLLTPAQMQSEGEELLSRMSKQGAVFILAPEALLLQDLLPLLPAPQGQSNTLNMHSFFYTQPPKQNGTSPNTAYSKHSAAPHNGK